MLEKDWDSYYRADQKLAVTVTETDWCSMDSLHLLFCFSRYCRMHRSCCRLIHNDCFIHVHTSNEMPLASVPAERSIEV